MQKGTLVRVLICLVCVTGIVFCISRIIPELQDYRKAERTYEKLEEQAVTVIKNPEASGEAETVISEEKTGGDTEEEVAVPRNENWWYEDVSIDFDLLYRQNRDIAAWIRFDDQDDIPIDYPVVLPDNDEQYLHKDIYGKASKAGTLFFEADNRTPVSDVYKKDIIYGHMMKNGSMFAPLKKYLKEKSFCKDHPYFTVYKKGEAFRYRIFSVFVTTAGSEVYEYGFMESDELYRKHIDYLKKHSEVHDYEPDYGHSILTLSTCAKSHSNQRIVVTGEQIDRKPTG